MVRRRRLLLTSLLWPLAACAQDHPSRGPAPAATTSAETASTMAVETVVVPPSASAPTSMETAASASGPSATASASSVPRDEKRCAELHAKPYPSIGDALAADVGPMVLHRRGADFGPHGRAVAAMAAGFRRCINDGLACDPEMHGTVRVSAKLDARGKVVSAEPVSAKGLSRGVIDCVVGVVKAKQFDPPDPGASTLVIPVSFQSAG